MKKRTKGEQTRSEILEKVNTFYNEQGLDHTLAEMASHIGMGKSRITNYFPKKELLIITLLQQHEEQLAVLVSKHHPYKKSYDFKNYIPFLAEVMELMFHHRGVIAYVMINAGMDDEILRHIQLNYARNKKRIRKRLENFEKNGLIKSTLLEPENFESYFFQYVCMSSNWIISYNLLDPDKTLGEVKGRYIRSILCCLHPYLTEKGHENLKTALMSLDGVRT
mgnify:CR=1 FL=1